MSSTFGSFFFYVFKLPIIYTELVYRAVHYWQTHFFIFAHVGTRKDGRALHYLTKGKERSSDAHAHTQARKAGRHGHTNFFPRPLATDERRRSGMDQARKGLF